MTQPTEAWCVFNPQGGPLAFAVHGERSRATDRAEYGGQTWADLKQYGYTVRKVVILEAEVYERLLAENADLHNCINVYMQKVKR